MLKTRKWSYNFDVEQDYLIFVADIGVFKSRPRVQQLANIFGRPRVLLSKRWIRSKGKLLPKTERKLSFARNRSNNSSPHLLLGGWYLIWRRYLNHCLYYVLFSHPPFDCATACVFHRQLETNRQSPRTVIFHRVCNLASNFFGFINGGHILNLSDRKWP